MRGSATREQPVEELPHPVAAQRDVGADRHALAQLELRDGLAGLGDLRLLAGDRGQVADRALDELGVAGGLADAHVDHDLDQTGHLHDVGVAELLEQLAGGSRRGSASSGAARPSRAARLVSSSCQMSLPERLATRTRTAWCARRARRSRRGSRPGSASSSPGPPACTLLMWIGASCVTMPPVLLPRRGLADLRVLLDPVDALDDDALGLGVDLEDLALLCALVLAARCTWTVSPFLIFILRHAQSTSGASEMIFMNFLSRSSRPTGPKMRVPRGSPSFLRITAAFSSKRM